MDLGNDENIISVSSADAESELETTSQEVIQRDVCSLTSLSHSYELWPPVDRAVAKRTSKCACRVSVGRRQCDVWLALHTAHSVASLLLHRARASMAAWPRINAFRRASDARTTTRRRRCRRRSCAHARSVIAALARSISTGLSRKTRSPFRSRKIRSHFPYRLCAMRCTR